MTNNKRTIMNSQNLPTAQRRMFFLATASLLLQLFSTTTLTSAANSMPKKDHEIHIIDSLNMLCNNSGPNLPAVKPRFADDAHIKFCLSGMTDDHCLEGTFDDTLDIMFETQGCRAFQVQGSGFRSSISDNHGIVSGAMMWNTKEGCRSNTSFSSFHEMNSEGKTSKLFVYSDDGIGFAKCFSPPPPQEEQETTEEAAVDSSASDEVKSENDQETKSEL